jgi:hypothetical protein
VGLLPLHDGRTEHLQPLDPGMDHGEPVGVPVLNMTTVDVYFELPWSHCVCILTDLGLTV